MERNEIAGSKDPKEPLAERPAAPADSGDCGGRSAVTRVLLIDQQHMQVGGMKWLLSLSDVQIDVCSSAEAAFTYLATQAPYDAILADVWLPQMSGLQFMARLRQPRLLLWSRQQLSTSAPFVDAVLRKPCPSQILLAALRGKKAP